MSKFVSLERERTCLFGHRTPATMAMNSDIVEELFVFLGRPESPPNFLLSTARMVTHVRILTDPHSPLRHNGRTKTEVPEIKHDVWGGLIAFDNKESNTKQNK